MTCPESKSHDCCFEAAMLQKARNLFEAKRKAHEMLRETYKREVIDYIIKENHQGRSKPFDMIRLERTEVFGNAEKEFTTFMTEIVSKEFSPLTEEPLPEKIPYCCHDTLTVKGLYRGKDCYCPKEGKS